MPPRNSPEDDLVRVPHVFVLLVAAVLADAIDKSAIYPHTNK